MRLVLAALTLPPILAACTRYEAAPGYESLARTPAPSECHPRAGSVMPMGPAEPPGATSDVQGTVRDEHGQPISQTLVRLAPDTTRWALSDSLGNFRMANVHPGRYLIRIAHIGYRPVADSVTVAAGTPQAYSVLLPVAMVDGPCGVVVMRKRPWWKW